MSLLPVVEECSDCIIIGHFAPVTLPEIIEAVLRVVFYWNVGPISHVKTSRTSHGLMLMRIFISTVAHVAIRNFKL